MSIWKTVLLLTVIGIVACEKNIGDLEFPIMGELELGPYSVGFQTHFKYDRSKTGVPFSDWDGHLTDNHSPELGRQYQINIWYPAKSRSGQSTNYRHHVHLLGRQTDFGEDGNYREVAEQIYINQINTLSGDSSFTIKELNQLMDLDVIEALDARPLSASFPTIIFPNGTSPANQSIMASFLASHGYVVVAFAPKGRFSFGMETSAVGIETAVDDLEFVLSHVCSLPFVEANQIALMANAISASVCLSAIARNQKIKALVSLEGGVPSAFEQKLLAASAFYEPENISVPILFIYAPHPSIDPEYTYHLKYAKRYYAHFPQMSEFAFLNFGMFDSFIPGIIGKQKGPVAPGFEMANKLVMRFLDLHLGQSPLKLFDSNFSHKGNDLIDTTFSHGGFSSLPPISELKHLFLRRGFGVIDSIYQANKQAGNDQPFSIFFLSAYRDWLAWKKDPTFQVRLRLYQLGLESFPQSAPVHYYLAYYLEKTGDIERSIDFYRKTISLLDEGKDLDLSKVESAQLRKWSNQALEELK